MKTTHREKMQAIIDLETLNVLNGVGCPACGRGFTLGEPVVVACGPWGHRARLIHANEAVYDAARKRYVEKEFAAAC